MLKPRDRAELRAEVEATLRDAPDDADALWLLGWIDYMDEHYLDAGDRWRAVAQLNPHQRGLGFWLPATLVRADLRIPGPIRGDDVAERPDGPVALTVAAGGDTMLGNDLKGLLPPDDGAALLAAVAEPFRAADVAFLNLEGTLADGLPSTKCGPSSTHCYAFRSPTRYTGLLVDAGIDVVSHANNHAMDLGEEGMFATAAALDTAGIAHTGMYGDTARTEAAGRSIAWVGAHTGECCPNVNVIHEIVQAVRDADADADLVILSFHGGAEGSKATRVPGRPEVAFGEQRGDVKALARAAVDAGADLVLGHGPHVLRAMEVYRGRFIAYSLGNLVGYRQFGTRGGPTAVSALLEVGLAPNGAAVDAKLHPLLLDGDAVPAHDPGGRAWRDVGERSARDFPDTGVRVGDDGQLSWPESGPR